MTAVFDDRIERIADYKAETDSAKPLAIFGYRHKDSKRQVVTVWQNGDAPRDSTDTEPVTVTVSNGDFQTPVFVDLRTGGVYEIPPANVARNGSNFIFKNIPVYDSPILIAEREIVLPTGK